MYWHFKYLSDDNLDLILEFSFAVICAILLSPSYLW
jgi:hypothetical protein